MNAKSANILIYGAGAIGSLMGYLLSDPLPSSTGDCETGGIIENVALLGRPGHMEEIRSEGLEVETGEGKNLLRFRYLFADLHELAKSDFYPDMVIICVKTYSLEKLCRDLTWSGLLDDRLKDACLLLLMNGMGNRELFQRLAPQAFRRAYEGITSCGVKLAANGKIELKGKGITVAEESLPPDIKQFMIEQFESRGFQIEFASDFKRHQWNKLFVNSVINPIAALSRQQNSIVLSAELRETVERVVREGVAVAHAEGMDFEAENVLDLVISVAEKTQKNSCSMLQDVQKNKTTEIDSINGYIIRLAKMHDIAVPVNKALYGLVKASARRASNCQCGQ